MSVRKIKGSWWVDFSFHSERVRKRSPENTRSGASDYELFLRRHVAQHGSVAAAMKALGPKAVAPTLTFAEFAERWLRDYVDVENKASEQKTKRRVLAADLYPVFGSVPLADISAVMIAQYKKKKQASGQSNKTINNQLTILRRCLDMAIEWGELEELPVIKFLRTAKPDFRFLVDEEIDRLVAAAPEGLWRTMILTAVRTGLRFSELIALEWKSVMPLGGRLSINVTRDAVDGIIGPTKNYQNRRLLLPKDASEMLARLPRTNELVFHREGGLIKRDCALWRIHRISANAGLEPLGWHVLRHTYASALAMRDVPLLTISRLMGHQSTSVTERYSHLRPSTLHRAVSSLEAPAPDFMAAGWQPGPVWPPSPVLPDRVMTPQLAQPNENIGAHPDVFQW